ncbi:MAG TPA: prolyl oligopeptidase family serine peptidase [Acidimicrobiales bacterium]|nr:prolyl oligopeptidase family serine peptidase [Acidimicrobiales bacterium]
MDRETIDTPRAPITSTFHGVAVTEDYRWLEDAASDQVRAWTTAQNERTRAFLGATPSYGAVRQRVEEIVRARSVAWGEWRSGVRRGGSAYFVLKREPPKQQPFLVALTDLSDLGGAVTLLDPNTIDVTGETAIDWFVPSPDGRFVAVSLSSHGTEDGTLHLIDVGSREAVDVRIPRVNAGTMGGSLAWARDGSGFWYTRGPAPGERADDELHFFQEIWHHQMGQPLDRDRRDQPRPLAEPKIAEHNLDSSADGAWVMDRVEKGDGGDWQVFLRAQDGGDWWQVADIDDECVDAAFGGDSLYLLARAGSPRGRVLRLRLAQGVTAAQARVIVPESKVAIEAVTATAARVWVLDIDGGPSGLRVCDLDGGDLRSIEVPPVSAIEGLSAVGDDEVVYALESFTMPRVWWSGVEKSVPRPTALTDETPFDLSHYEVWRDVAVSLDGTQVPMTLVSAADIPRDGPVPTILYGYGGYGISLKPSFDPTWLPWLEQGAVLAVANIRGGGEYGEEWHERGSLTSKQHVFDDFAACARRLVQSGVTSATKLALKGGSNGGLLMGAVLTQHPELARVVVALVPVMDMLRVELHPNGAFNVTEYGSVNDPAQFEALYAYSPYHNVEDGIAYPATLLTAGEYDPRVDAYHAKKMAARLQEATTGPEPVLLRVKATGHGIGEPLDETAAELTDLYAFIFDRLAVEYRPPDRRPS